MSIKFNTLQTANCTECGNVWSETHSPKGDERLRVRVEGHRCKAMMQKEIDELKNKNKLSSCGCYTCIYHQEIREEAKEQGVTW